jgi:hypothetical protein
MDRASPQLELSPSLRHRAKQADSLLSRGVGSSLPSPLDLLAGWSLPYGTPAGVGLIPQAESR